MYTVTPYSSERFTNVWKINHVAGRTGILIHAGNDVSDVSGCIAVAQSLAGLTITRSNRALAEMRQLLAGLEHFNILIKHIHINEE